MERKKGRQRIAVLGAGPVGLEAGLRAVEAGHRVTILEAGDVAENVRSWGHVRVFTPFGMNHTPLGSRRLVEAGVELPPDKALLTGRELRDAYLLPLSRLLSREARLRTRTRVVSVSRSHLLKDDAIGDPVRAEDPFRILIDAAGAEEVVFADCVLDCTGTYGRPNWMGPGGAPAVGERAARARVRYDLPDVVGADRASFGGGRTLVVGTGHSAGTTVVSLADLSVEQPGTSFVWVTRGAGGEGPLPRIPDDALPARAALTNRANRVATSPPPGSAWMPGAEILALGEEPGGGFTVTLLTAGHLQHSRFDAIVANVGYEPDDSLYRQLQIHECYASRAPMKLAAALLAQAGDGPVDCLTAGRLGPEVLRNPEPGYYVLGMKSYGRSGGFLLRTGHEQIEDLFDSLVPAAPGG